VQLYAFDILALDGDDRRALPLSMRKTNLARLLARRPEGIFVAPFEQGEIGPDLFQAACKMGLEGLVSKRRDRPYRAGRCPHWIKVKNRSHPAINRVADAHANRDRGMPSGLYFALRNPSAIAGGNSRLSTLSNAMAALFAINIS
jgi:ATP-dependent DNA ligase